MHVLSARRVLSCVTHPCKSYQYLLFNFQTVIAQHLSWLHVLESTGAYA